MANKRYTVQQLNASAEASTVAEETYGCIRTVRAFAQEGAACGRYDASVRATQQWGVAAARLSGFFGVFSYMIGTGTNDRRGGLDVLPACLFAACMLYHDVRRCVVCNVLVVHTCPALSLAPSLALSLALF